MSPKRSTVLASLIGPALCLLAAAQSASAQALGPVVLPQDEAPHPNSWVEWWYFTGHLTGIDWLGETHDYGYGFELTFGRDNQLGFEPVSALYYGNFAITDLTRGSFTANGNDFALQPDVIPPGGGFNNTIGLWHMDGKNGLNHLFAGRHRME